MTGQPCSSPNATSAAASGTTRLTGHGAPSAVSRSRMIALSWACTSAAGPGPDHHAGRLQIAQQTGRHVLVVEGDHVAAGGEGAYGLGVGVVPHRDVVHDRGRRDVRALGQQPDVDAQPDRRRVHHPGQLAAADDADGERTRTGAARHTHPRKRTGSAQPEDDRPLDDEVHRRGHALGDDEADHLHAEPAEPLARSAP